jgi:hypothetical protein
LEEIDLRIAPRLISSLILAAAITAPMAIVAAATPNDDGVQIRVYDRNHKDYHNWDDHENTAWGVYLTNNHRKPHEFAHSSRREQANYWNWRHSHPD